MLAVIYGSLWGPRRRRRRLSLCVSRHFVSQSPRFRGVVNQANTSRPRRGLYEPARRTRRVVGAPRQLYDGHASVKNRHAYSTRSRRVTLPVFRNVPLRSNHNKDARCTAPCCASQIRDSWERTALHKLCALLIQNLLSLFSSNTRRKYSSENYTTKSL